MYDGPCSARHSTTSPTQYSVPSLLNSKDGTEYRAATPAMGAREKARTFRAKNSSRSRTWSSWFCTREAGIAGKGGRVS